MDKIDCSNLNKLSLEEWDCKACPIAEDLLKWLDDLSRANADLEKHNKRLLDVASRRSHARS